MKLEITNISGKTVIVQPRVELYSVSDFMGTMLPGLAIALDKVGRTSEDLELYAFLTVSFGEFISIKNSAYIDTNNCLFAEQLLSQGIAEQTPFTKRSGFCQYPLWIFKEDFLKEAGGEAYQRYSPAYDEYFQKIAGGGSQ